MKAKYIVFVTILFLLQGCSNQVCHCEVKNEIIQSNDSIISSWKNGDWWSEIGIGTASQFDNDFYRLTIFPSWNNSTVTQYTLENKKSNPTMSIIEYQKNYSDKKYHIKKMGGIKSFTLDSKNWTEFDKFFEGKCFSNMPVVTGEQYLDGVSWILESKTNDASICTKRQYHIVSRVAKDSSFFAICDEILKLGNSSRKEQDSLLSISWRTD